MRMGGRNPLILTPLRRIHPHTPPSHPSSHFFITDQVGLTIWLSSCLLSSPLTEMCQLDRSRLRRPHDPVSDIDLKLFHTQPGDGRGLQWSQRDQSDAEGLAGPHKSQSEYHIITKQGDGLRLKIAYLIRISENQIRLSLPGKLR